eukprot:1326300-Amphidinium_carterae.1
MSGSHHAPAKHDNPDPNVYLVPKSAGVGKFRQLIILLLMGNFTTDPLALPPPPKAQTQQSSDTELTPRSRVRRLMNQNVLGAGKSWGWT